jgi:sugar phosphate isomerase/epimerase
MYADREERLKRALDAAQAMGATSLRTFTFWRVAEPRSLYPRLVDLLGSMGETVRRAGCELLVETEYATNVATCEEMRDIMAMLPARNIGINWDPQNSLMLEKDVFPAGYEKLPKARIRNVQIKAAGLFGNSDGSGILDWAGIMSRLHRDGYKGLFGLETHYGSGPRNYAMSEKCMAEMQRIAATVGK